ncbi:MAG: TonB-dependent receptor domain-containing protein [Bacteroidota bacterium]
MNRSVLTFAFLLIGFTCFSQVVTGTVTDEQGNPMAFELYIDEALVFSQTHSLGTFRVSIIPGLHDIAIFAPGYKTQIKKVEVSQSAKTELNFLMEDLSDELSEVVVVDTKTSDPWMLSVDGVGIYEAKKTEVIQLDNLVASKAVNVSRQIYSRVPGLNIWENDGAGLQLGIGGRGLSPNRTSNFNVRQNGYDISADALGYPESYYTPPSLALDKIEIIRGAAGLQYGTQFGGLLNFHFKEAPQDKKIDVNMTNTLGSFGLFNTFNSIGGTVGKFRYYGFYQYKHSNGWRPNSGLDQHNVYGSIGYHFNPFLTLKFEHTHMNYLAQQPGGLTDSEFYQNPRQSKRTRNWFEVGWDLSAMEWNYRVTPNLKFNNRTFHLSANRYAVGNLSRIDRPDDLNGNRNLLKDNYNNWGNEFRTVIHYPLLGTKSVLLLGNRVYFGQTLRAQGEANNLSKANFDFINPEEPDDSDFTFPSRNISFFAENIFNLTDKWSITPGIRYEFIRTSSDGYYFNEQEDFAGNIIFSEKVDEQKSKDRSLALVGIGISYKPNETLEAYTNFSQNFRAINFNDIRVDNPSLTVDENISDESGYNLDLGIRGNKSNLKYDLSLFYLSYRDRIGNILKTGADPRFTFYVPKTFRFRTNVGDASIFGMESYLEGDLLRLLGYTPKNINLTGFINFAALESRYLENEDASIEGNDVELVPPVNIKTGLTFKYKSFGVSYQYSYVAQHYSDATNADNSPTSVEGIIPSYSVMDISFTYDWKLFHFETGVNNLLNNYYFTRRAAGYPGPGIIPSDGRSGYITVGINL